MVYRDRFKDIAKRFGNELRKEGKDLTYSILGTPLRKSKVLMMGSNWGGAKGDSQWEMPLVCDILNECYKPGTYNGYLNFFLQIFEDDLGKTIDFFNRIVYTNGNFVRTPNEKSEYQTKIQAGNRVTPKFLREIIDFVEADIILCFGNSENSATNSLFKTLEIETNFWKLGKEIMHHSPTCNDWGTYHYPNLKTKYGAFQIFSFPHASQFNRWKKDIDKNPNFQTLQKQLLTL
jgi:hypothetical protein